MSHVAIVTDSASDMAPARAAELGVSLVPLIVSFGSESFKAGVDLSAIEFWERMTAPGAPFPTTAASAPGDFRAAYEAAFAAGADAIVSIHVAGTLSGTIKSAEIARGMFPDREIRVVDSMGASMGVGLLVELAVDMARLDVGAAEIARVCEERRADVATFVALDTLEYLKRGGRISGAQAAIGSLLSVKPIVEVRDGQVVTADKVRTKGKARERLIELVCIRPMERLSILHTTNAEAEAFREQLLTRVPGGIDPAKVTIDLVGPSVGPHLGPGCVGAVALYRHHEYGIGTGNCILTGRRGDRRGDPAPPRGVRAPLRGVRAPPRARRTGPDARPVPGGPFGPHRQGCGTVANGIPAGVARRPPWLYSRRSHA